MLNSFPNISTKVAKKYIHSKNGMTALRSLGKSLQASRFFLSRADPQFVKIKIVLSTKRNALKKLYIKCNINSSK